LGKYRGCHYRKCGSKWLHCQETFKSRSAARYWAR
jgi:hypothetical protein